MSDDSRVAALERENRKLARKLERALENQARLEDLKEANSAFLRTVIEQMTAKEDELVQKNLALEAATAAKSIFLANMSHELRTPLNAIMGYAELVLEEVEEPSVQGDLAAILTASRGLLGLIDDILDLTKIESGRLEIVHSPFDAGQLVDQLVSTISPLVRARGLRLVVDSPSWPARLIGDELRCRQVLTNLVSNAVKFTEEGHIALIVTLDGSWVRFRVEDTGIGMTPEQLERVFDPFVQADSSTTRRFGGTGLGLSIARRLADLMDGALLVRSVPGEGTTMELVLPARFEG
ncbi:MAG: hybrid sensor histidine kinase/response regulator, partial [Myxococcales bacterium]|nr:hybrid sensor histidine kinase/response regulator [Myxococcales bacterium]